MNANAATVTVDLANVEPVKTFIADVAEADTLFRQMTSNELTALSGPAMAGIAKVQRALMILGGHVAAHAETGEAAGHVPGARPPRY